MSNIAGITIRRANVDDAPAIARMAQALAAFEGECSLADEAAVRAMCASEDEPRCQCLMVKVNEEPVAFALYYAGYDLASASYGFHLADLYVEECYRGQGIGTELLGAIATHAAEEKREWLSLTALNRNEVAQGFYDSVGFTRVAVDFFAAGKQSLARLEARFSA